ncbi:MAG TPA: TMEM175 family protein [Ktedonobacteraceae bacterium]|jgi:uncharacterized membrane protein
MKEAQKQFSRFISDEKTPNEDRLVMLCDGVFAIAITLLVIDIGLYPANSSIKAMNAALEALIRPTVSYMVTFLIIAMYWRFHRNLMQVVQRLDNTFVSLTFLFLAFIAFFPVTSKLVGDYGDNGPVIIIYTLGLSGCSFSALALWWYATWKHRLVSPDLPQDSINTRTISLLLNPLIYCASLLLLFVIPRSFPYLICFSWVLIGYTQRGVRHIYTRWLAKPVHELMHREHDEEALSVPQHLAEKLPDTPVGDNIEKQVPEEAE